MEIDAVTAQRKTRKHTHGFRAELDTRAEVEDTELRSRTRTADLRLETWRIEFNSQGLGDKISTRGCVRKEKEEKRKKT